MGHSAVGGKSLAKYGMPSYDEEGSEQHSEGWNSESESEEDSGVITDTSKPTHYMTAEKSPISAQPKPAVHPPKPAKPAPAAHDTHSLTTVSGHKVAFALVPLVTGDSTSFGSALRNGEKDGTFYVISEPPVHASSLQVALDPPRVTSRSITKETVFLRHLAKIARDRKTDKQPYQRIIDVCGYLLWLPNQKKSRSESDVKPDGRIYRFFRVWNTDASENNETIIIATNATDKDGPADLLEDAHTQQTMRQKIAAWRENGKVAPDNAPVEFVIDMGWVEDGASNMTVGGVRVRPVATTSRVMALAVPPGQRKAATVPIPPPEPTPPAVAPPLVVTAEKHARVEEEPPVSPPVKRSRPSRAKPASGVELFECAPLPPPSISSAKDPFLPFTEKCPEMIVERSMDFSSAIDKRAASLFQSMLVAAPETLSDSQCNYTVMSHSVNVLRGKQTDIAFVSPAIYAFWVLASGYFYIDSVTSNQIRTLLLCGKNLWEKFGKGVQKYIPEIVEYMENKHPEPASNTPMHLAFEMLVALGRHLLQN